MMLEGTTLRFSPLSDLVPTAPAEVWLKGELDARRALRASPPPDPSLGADYLSYNISTRHVTYDFTSVLVDGEMTRVREGAPAPLKVGFVSGPHGRVELHGGWHEVMFKRVLRPMLALIGAVEDPQAVYGRGKWRLGYKNVVDAARRGERVPTLTAPGRFPGFEGKSPVTITLREEVHSLNRNSRVPDWLRFAEYLKSRGEYVVLVRDTRVAGAALGDWQICSLASVDLHARMALYQQAKCNLFVSNGPWNLALFSAKPWLMFIEEGEVNSPEMWRHGHGLRVGEQFPWSSSQQRMIWKSDTYENLRAAWEETYG